MSVFASILFPVGAVAIAIAFAAHVGHAVLLANGRRSLALSLNPSPQRPAWSGTWGSGRPTAVIEGVELATARRTFAATSTIQL